MMPSEAYSPPVPSPSEIRPSASEFEAGFQPNDARNLSKPAETLRRFRWGGVDVEGMDADRLAATGSGHR